MTIGANSHKCKADVSFFGQYKCIQSNFCRDFFGAMAESCKNVKDTTAFSLFLVC